MSCRPMTTVIVRMATTLQSLAIIVTKTVISSITVTIRILGATGRKKVKHRHEHANPAENSCNCHCLVPTPIQ